MEVGFTVNAGPLSQISVHLFSLETAVQLATGALGWWRGPQWTQSLQQTLEAGNAALVPAQTFVRHRYTDFRNDNGGVYGAAMDAGRRFVRMPLPRASTALSEDAGVDCVRALIVGLSCFMDGDQIYGLLKELVPQYLLHTGQDDQPRRLHGASLTAMKNFVTAVLYEETVDKLRDRLFDIIDSQLPRITGASRSELHASRRTEVCHISGVLRWILKPAYKFEGSTKPVYLTRSLKVWALALILAELGFEVEAARSAISSPYDSQQHASFSHDSHLGLPEVVLALTGGWPTDIGASRLSPQAHKLLEEPFRVIPIRAIPILAYAEFLPKITLSTEYLQEAFNGAFIHVQRCLRRQQWVSRATDVQVTETEDIRSHSANEEIILMGSLEEIFGIWTDLHHEDRGMTDRLLLAKGHPRLLLKGLVAKFGVCASHCQQLTRLSPQE